MVEISSIEYAFSKLNFKKEKERQDKAKQAKFFKIYYRNDKNEICTVIRNCYELERTTDIHKNIICIVDLSANRNIKIFEKFLK